MPGISLSSLRGDSRKLRLQFGPDVLRVTIFPHRLTNEVLDRFRDAAEDRDYDEMAAAFGEVVTEWDLTANDGDDEPPLPIDGETFRIMSTTVINGIWTEISEIVNPKSRKKNHN